MTNRTRSYLHDPAVASYGLEAAEALGVAPERVFKTLLLDTGEGLAVAVVPADRMLDLKAVAAALGVKRATMKDPHEAERATGYVVGGISTSSSPPPTWSGSFPRGPPPSPADFGPASVVKPPHVVRSFASSRPSVVTSCPNFELASGSGERPGVGGQGHPDVVEVCECPEEEGGWR